MKLIRAALLWAILLAPAWAQAQSNGPVVYPTVTPPVSIPAGNTVTSACVASNGYPRVSAGALSSQAGAIAIQRFVDATCQVALDSPPTRISVNFTANTPGAVAAADGAPFGSFEVLVSNSSGSQATVTTVNPGWIALSRTP